MTLHPKSPPIFPAPWANEWGEDEYGLWMAFSYQGHRHAFRWIPPGSFTMGSPESEEGRNHRREAQRKVTFEDGFWLGEFPVTAGLYQTIMEFNPKIFREPDGEHVPIEDVSWHDAQEFIATINQLHPELTTYLPLDSQWEYACRAGTSSAFNYGEQISRNHVNYSGKWDWNDRGSLGGALGQANIKGKYPKNDWGLFDMHGNVWEWCLDPSSEESNSMPMVVYLAEDLPSQNKKAGDIAIQDKETLFCIRGGGWLTHGLNCRSATRGSQRADRRDEGIGFRLCLPSNLK